MTRAETTFERARVLFDAARPADRSVPVSVPGYAPPSSSTPGVHDVNDAAHSHRAHGEHQDYAEARAMLSAEGAGGVLPSVARAGSDVALQLTRAAIDLFRAHARNGGLAGTMCHREIPGRSRCSWRVRERRAVHLFGVGWSDAALTHAGSQAAATHEPDRVGGPAGGIAGSRPSRCRRDRAPGSVSSGALGPGKSVWIRVSR